MLYTCIAIYIKIVTLCCGLFFQLIATDPTGASQTVGRFRVETGEHEGEEVSPPGISTHAGQLFT